MQFQETSIPPPPIPPESQWKYQGGEWWQKQKFLKKSMELDWNFQRGGGCNKKKKPVGKGRVWVFYGSTQFFTGLENMFYGINFEKLMRGNLLLTRYPEEEEARALYSHLSLFSSLLILSSSCLRPHSLFAIFSMKIFS